MGVEEISKVAQHKLEGKPTFANINQGSDY